MTRRATRARSRHLRWHESPDREAGARRARPRREGRGAGAPRRRVRGRVLGSEAHAGRDRAGGDRRGRRRRRALEPRRRSPRARARGARRAARARRGRDPRRRRGHRAAARRRGPEDARCPRRVSHGHDAAHDRRRLQERVRGEEGMRDAKLSAGTPIKPVYGPEDLAGRDADRDIGRPGEYPYTRGIHTKMYRDRLWTMRQYIGFGTPGETNARFKYLMAHGQDALNVAFDLPTQLGLDSDDPRAEGEVGRVGMAIDTLADMEEAFAGIPLDKVSVSLTINGMAAPITAIDRKSVVEGKSVDL